MKEFIFLISFCAIYFVAMGQEPRLVLPIGHTAGISSSHFSPNGKLIVTSSQDKTIKIWDAQTGNLLSTLIGHSDWVTSAIFSQDNSKILSTSEDYTVKLWDVKSGKLIRNFGREISFVGHDFENYFATASFTSDGKKILTVSAERSVSLELEKIYKSGYFPKEIKVWEVGSGKLVFQSKGRAGAISASGKNIAILTNENFITVVNIANQKTFARIKTFFTGTVQEISFSSDGSNIMLKTGYENVQVWNIVTRKRIINLKTDVENCRFSDDGKKIITVFKSTIKIFDAFSGKQIDKLNLVSSGNNKILVCTNGNNAAVYNDSLLCLWDIFKRKQVLKYNASLKMGVGLELDAMRKKILIASNSFIKGFEVVDLKFKTLISHYESHAQEVKQILTTSDQKLLVTIQVNGGFQTWNRQNGQLIKTVQSDDENYIYSTACLSPNNKLIAISYRQNERKIKEYVDKDDWKNLKQILVYKSKLKIWNVETGKLDAELIGHNGDIKSIQFSKNGKELLTASEDSTTRIWNVQSGLNVATLNGQQGRVDRAVFSHDGNKVLTLSGDTETALLWNFKTKTILHTFKCHYLHRYKLLGEFSLDDSKIITASENNNVCVWNASTGSLISNLNNPNYGITDATFSLDGKQIVTASSDNDAKVWDAQSGKNRLKLVGHKGEVTSVMVSQQYIITASKDNTIKIWDAQTGKAIKDLHGHTNNITSVSFDSIQDKILTHSDDFTIKVWDLSNEGYSSFFPVDSTDYFIQTSIGFYQTTPNAAKLLHYVTKDLKVITFDQLDVKYNRPDKVLEAIGNTDTALINSYRKAYQKRIKKLGIDTTQFADGYSVPEADFVNRDNIDYEQNKNKLTLTIKANDSIYKLDRFNVWVNEVPVFGLRGIKVKRKNSFDTTITITLSQGENRIEASVTNINGTESYKMPLFVKYTTAKPQPSKQHFIGIGINQFSNTDYNLNWSVKDIRDLAIKFKSKYPNIIIDTLFDKNVTKENVLGLKKKLLQLNEDDKVIISYSGHGILSKDFDYFLSTYNINFAQPEENGLAYDDLESLLDNIKPRQKLLLIDACHSGEVDKDELLKIETAKTELNKNGVATKSTIKVVKKEKQLGLANSFELMQNLFVNVGKGTGATIISAAGGTQYAQERGDLKNGVFTYSIIEAMNNNTKLTVSELKKLVGERVTQLTNGLQKPTSRNETNNYDWLVW